MKLKGGNGYVVPEVFYLVHSFRTFFVVVRGFLVMKARASRGKEVIHSVNRLGSLEYTDSPFLRGTICCGYRDGAACARKQKLCGKDSILARRTIKAVSSCTTIVNVCPNLTFSEFISVGVDTDSYALHIRLMISMPWVMMPFFA